MFANKLFKKYKSFILFSKNININIPFNSISKKKLLLTLKKKLKQNIKQTKKNYLKKNLLIKH